MIQIAKLFLYLLRELIFDSKDEYDFKSKKFNARKFIVLILLSLSFVLNTWLFYRFSLLAKQYWACQEQVTQNTTQQEPVVPSTILYKYEFGIPYLTEKERNYTSRESVESSTIKKP